MGTQISSSQSSMDAFWLLSQGIDLFLGWLISIARKAEQDANVWLSVAGMVQSSRPVKKPWSASSNHRAVYPEVTYSFEVDGKTYTNQHIWPGGEIGGAGTSFVLERYPAGSQVTVYYDPKIPENAVLEKKIRKSEVAMVWSYPYQYHVLYCVADLVGELVGAQLAARLYRSSNLPMKKL